MRTLKNMNEIILNEPVPSHSALERLHLFAGRHLGEEEFDRQQAYVDRRIERLLAGVHSGIVDGLQVRVGQFTTTQEGFSVSPGLAVAGNGLTLGLYYPLRQTWHTLIDEYITESGAADAAGVYYLTLRRSHRYVDADPGIDPCQRDEFDPTRDARRVVVGSVALRRLAIDTAAVTGSSRERIENWVAANNVDGQFLLGMSNAIPLGLLAVERTGVDGEGLPTYAVNWFSEEAGRYHAVPYSGYHVLLQQTTSAFRRMLLAADDDSRDTLTYILDELQMDFLPAAGELPRELITNIASTTPGISWLPNHLGIDMVAVPEESVSELIERHLPRRVIDLREPAGDRLRLLLAVNEPDYKPELLDYPQTDAQLNSDTFRYFMRAYDVWREWMRRFNNLYFLTEEDVLDEEELSALDLPEPVAAPQLPQDFFQQVIDESETELGTDENAQAYYPYNQGVPDFPQFYRNWGVVDTGQPGNPVMPPALQDPSTNGLVIQYSIARVDLEELDNVIRETRARLEKTRDYLLLQRQQLDSQTVSLAALAGGVAGDGSGLQVARWLPFTKLTANTVSDTPEEPVVDTNFSFDAIKPSYMNYTANPTISKTAEKATKNNFVFATTLRKSATTLSTLQFNLNNLRLDKIAEAPKQALTKPAFEAKEFRFGVLEHIRPEIQEYKKAIRGMTELLSTLDGLFDTAEAKSIKAQLNSYGKPASLEDLGIEATTVNSEELAPRLYEALFDAGKILTKQIAYIEGRYARIEAKLEGKLRLRLRKENFIEKLVALIRKATEELENIDKRRIEFLGDYGVAQRLVDDDWLDIYHENQERTRILTTGIKGVYFVRVRQTPISASLADPLELRFGKSSDIVPGCDWEEDVELPGELEDFYDTVLEVPMNDWAALKDLHVYVPPVKRLNYIYTIRKARLYNKTSNKRKKAMTARPVRVSLFNVRQQSQSLLTNMARFSFPLTIASAKNRQQETARVLSLEDILSGTRGRLQKQAQILSNRLEQAIACLLEKLDELPPSLRLQWAQLAEDDRLRVDRVEQWPGLDRAERDDFNATRTVAELVAWWFRQLDKAASSEARSAMRNMIRASVIQSALGDPAEILHGQVHVPPRRLALGEPLRLKLNRAAKLGTTLQLMDPQQRIVAMLNVEDDDAQGTIAKITRVTRHKAVIDTRYRVVASKLTRQLKT
jgi:hypothetical protein